GGGERRRARTEEEEEVGDRRNLLAGARRSPRGNGGAAKNSRRRGAAERPKLQIPKGARCPIVDFNHAGSISSQRCIVSPIRRRRRPANHAEGLEHETYAAGLRAEGGGRVASISQ